MLFFVKGDEVQPNNYLYKNAKKKNQPKKHLPIQIIHPFGISTDCTLNAHILSFKKVDDNIGIVDTNLPRSFKASIKNLMRKADI